MVHVQAAPPNLLYVIVFCFQEEKKDPVTWHLVAKTGIYSLRAVIDTGQHDGIT